MAILCLKYGIRKGLGMAENGVRTVLQNLWRPFCPIPFSNGSGGTFGRDEGRRHICHVAYSLNSRLRRYSDHGHVCLVARPKVSPTLGSCERRGRSGGITLSRDEGELGADFTTLGSGTWQTLRKVLPPPRT